MATIPAHLYDGTCAEARSVTLEFTSAVLRVLGSNFQEFSLSALRVSPRIGGANRFIALPNGQQIGCPDCVVLEQLPQTHPTESLVAWLDNRWWVALAATALTLVGLCCGYAFGVPVVAKAIAVRVPFEREALIRDQVLAALDDTGAFHETQLTAQQISSLKAVFDRVAADQKVGKVASLEVRSAPTIGANALALPGGTVVVTDGLVHLSKNQEELAGVLAHEFGHLERRHVLRSALQNAGILAAAGALLGDASSVVVFGSLPALLASLKYSRDMETEADDFALNWLRSRGIPPEQLAGILERLSAQPNAQQIFSYLSTHPDPELRIHHMRTEAQRHTR